MNCYYPYNKTYPRWFQVYSTNMGNDEKGILTDTSLVLFCHWISRRTGL
jgi:hypothetical protein